MSNLLLEFSNKLFYQQKDKTRYAMIQVSHSGFNLNVRYINFIFSPLYGDIEYNDLNPSISSCSGILNNCLSFLVSFMVSPE